jgi:hypothetical protein
MTSSPNLWLARWRKVEAAMWLALASATMKLLPFRHFARLMIGRAMLPSPQAGASSVRSQTGPAILAEVAVAVSRAAHVIPFPARCLVQAVAAKRMLAWRDHPTILHLSVRMTDASDPVEPGAHAWLTWHDVPVIGGGPPTRQVEIARFS